MYFIIIIIIIYLDVFQVFWAGHVAFKILKDKATENQEGWEWGVEKAPQWGAS